MPAELLWGHADKRLRKIPLKFQQKHQVQVVLFSDQLGSVCSSEGTYGQKLRPPDGPGGHGTACLLSWCPEWVMRLQGDVML